MNKMFLLIVVGAFLFTNALLSNGSETQPAGEYDEETYGPEAPIVWTKPVKAVIFEHKVHTMGAKLGCESCHDGLFEMESGLAEQNADFTMKTLYDGGYCGACHDGATAFASDTQCTACHIGVRGHARMLGGGGSEEGGHH